MIVAELIEALKTAPLGAKVEIVWAGQNSWTAAYVAVDRERRHVLICDSNIDAPNGEIALFDEKWRSAS